MSFRKRSLHNKPSTEEFEIRSSGSQEKTPQPENPQLRKKGRIGTVLLLIAGFIAAAVWIVACAGDSDQKSEETYAGSSLGLPKITPPAFEDVFTPASESTASSSTDTEEIPERGSTVVSEDEQETAESAGIADDWNQAVRKISESGYVWQTGSSIAARKQFLGDKIFNYAGGQDDPFAYELISVTNLTGISDNHGDGVAYVYVTNTGNQYYLYENDDDFLECHWEPDGYSGSDSLTRVSDHITENTPMIRMDSDQTTDITFDVRSVSVFSGYYNDSDNELCLAVNLETPVYIRRSDRTDGVVHSIQIYGDAVDNFIENRGLSFEIGEADGYVVENSSCQVTGNLREPDTNHHYTYVLMEITSGLD